MTTPLPSDGCSWPIVYPPGGDCGPDPDPDRQELIETLAGDYLARWTNYAYGQCPVTVRPCRLDCVPTDDPTFWGFGPYTAGSSALGAAPFGPVLVNGAWFNISCGQCGDNCSCGQGGMSSVALPGPVSGVEEVLIDGAALPADAYRVDNLSLLVRTDGKGWPPCQNMVADTTEVGTWSVSYLKGLPVPLGGQVAAGVLACELGLAMDGDSSCQLPRGVNAVFRQGVQLSLPPLAAGQTGIYLVDSWVASVTTRPRASRVFSVDIARPRNRTTTWP